MEQDNLCICCMTNLKKSKHAKYCTNCSEYVCSMILQRTHKIDARYKKVFRSLFSRLQQLSSEDIFLPKQLKEIVAEKEKGI